MEESFVLQEDVMGQSVIFVKNYIQTEKKDLFLKKHKCIYIIKKKVKQMKIIVSGASGKTGYRIVEECKKKGYKVKQLIRKNSTINNDLKDIETERISLADNFNLDNAIRGSDALIIATGARPSIDLTGPLKVDALGVYRQLESCKRVGVKRVILVSSLCTGKLLHPLNLFGLILIWKKIGENFLKNPNFDWTIVRPGGLSENEETKDQNVLYSNIDTQFEGSIPRRLVAKCCVNALDNKNSINKTIEITSSKEYKNISFEKAMQII